jgi:hypothetical protein
MDGGRWVKATTAMLVASGISGVTSCALATAAMPSMPPAGSSRHSTMPASSLATHLDVSTVHAALESRRRSRPGNAAWSALMDAALDLDGREAVLVYHLLGLLDEPFRVERCAVLVVGLARVPAPLVKEICRVGHRVPYATAK